MHGFRQCGGVRDRWPVRSRATCADAASMHTGLPTNVFAVQEAPCTGPGSCVGAGILYCITMYLGVPCLVQTSTRLAIRRKYFLRVTPPPVSACLPAAILAGLRARLTCLPLFLPALPWPALPRPQQPSPECCWLRPPHPPRSPRGLLTVYTVSSNSLCTV
jgi:hypothetical protein